MRLFKGRLARHVVRNARCAPILILLLFLFSGVGTLLAKKEFAMPKAAPAASYPAHDNHAKEQVAIGADPYPAGKESPFSVRFEEHGILPVFFVVTNDSDMPVELTDIRIQLVTVERRAKIEPSSDDDIYRKLSRTVRRGDEARRNPLPIPLPGGGPKVGVKKNVREEIETANFRARAVEPHATQAGFLFFDVSDLREPLKGAHLYITGVRDGNGEDMMYFDIPLDQTAQ